MSSTPSGPTIVTPPSAGEPSVATTRAFDRTSTPAARSRSVALPASVRGRSRPRGRRRARASPAASWPAWFVEKTTIALPDEHSESLEVSAWPRTRASRRGGRSPRTRSAVRARRSRGRRAARPHVVDDVGRAVALVTRRRSRRRRCRSAVVSASVSTPSGGCVHDRLLVDEQHAAASPPRRPPRPAAPAADHQRLDVPVGVHARSAAATSSPGSTPTPARLRQRPCRQPRCTIVAGRIGSNHGAVISTNAFGSSTPAVITPRGRPRIGDTNPPRHAVREQGARDRVAREPLDVPSVEREASPAAPGRSRRRPSRADVRSRRPLLADPVGRDHPVRGRVADRVEPPPAARRVRPTAPPTRPSGCRA